MAIVQCAHCGHKIIQLPQREQCPLCEQPFIPSPLPETPLPLGEDLPTNTHQKEEMVEQGEYFQAYHEEEQTTGDAQQEDEEEQATGDAQQEDEAAQAFLQRFTATIDELLNAPSWDEARSIIEANKDILFLPQAVPILEVIAAELRKNDYPAVAEHIDMYRDVLVDSEAHGFDMAWESFLKMHDQAREAMRDLLLAPMQGSSLRQALLDKQAILLSPIVVAVLYRAIAHFGSGTTHANAYYDYLLQLLLEARKGNFPSQEEGLPPIDEEKLSPDGSITMFPGVKGIDLNDPEVKQFMQELSTISSEERDAWLGFSTEVARWTDFPVSGKGDINIRPQGKVPIQRQIEQLLPRIDRAKQPHFWAQLRNMQELVGFLDDEGSPVLSAEPEFSVEEAPVQWVHAQIARGFYALMMPSANFKRETAQANFDRALSLLDPVRNSEEWHYALVGRASIQTYRRNDTSRQLLNEALADIDKAVLYFAHGHYSHRWAMAMSTRNWIYVRLAELTGDRVKYFSQLLSDSSLLISSCRDDEAVKFIYYDTLLVRAMVRTTLTAGDQNQNTQAAIQDLEEIIQHDEQYKPLTEHWAVVRYVLGMAYFYLTTGQRDQNVRMAVECCNQALQVFLPDKEPIQWARALFLRALAYSEYAEGSVLRNKEKAFADLMSASTIITAETYPLDYALLHANLGNLYLTRLAGSRSKNVEMAVKHFNKSLAFFTREEHAVNWAVVLVSRGTAYRYLAAPDVGTAHLYTISSSEIFQRLFLPIEEGNIITMAGHLLTDHHKYIQLALKDFDDALTVLSPEMHVREWSYACRERAATQSIYLVWNNLTGDPDSMADLDKVLTIYQQQNLYFEWATTLNNRALFYFSQLQSGKRSAAQKALKDLEAAETVFTRHAYPIHYRNLYAFRARVYTQLKQWDAAHEALTVVRDVQRQTVMNAPTAANRLEEIAEISLRDIYVHDAQILVKLHRHEDALLVLEEGRAQSLRVLLASDMFSVAGTYGDEAASQRRQAFLEVHEAWREQQQALNIKVQQGIWTGADLSVAEAQLEVIWQELMRLGEAIRQYDDPDFMSPMPTMQDIERALILHDEALVYLVSGVFMGASEGMAFIITRGNDGRLETRYLNLPHLSTEAIANLFTPALDALYPIKVSEAIHSLGSCGLTAVAQALRANGKIHRIRLVPYGRLGLFPLPSVIISTAGGKHQTLSDLFEVTLMPSARVSEVSYQHLQTHHQHLCMVGNPQPLLEEYRNLPYAEAEAEVAGYLACKHGYEPGGVDNLLTVQATKLTVIKKLQQAWYAHLALHGEYLYYDPQASQLILSGDETIPEGERTLSLRETLDGRVDLQGLRLLVLSACETSKIDIERVPNEGLGMATGFIRAGVAGIIASLWRVDDRATYLLMSRFVDLYLDTSLQLSPAQALAMAQSWLREEVTYQLLSTYKPRLLAFTVQKMSETQQKVLHAIRTSAEKEAQTNPLGLPYTDAYYWASFILTGR